jgi:hypothetical protein
MESKARSERTEEDGEDGEDGEEGIEGADAPEASSEASGEASAEPSGGAGGVRRRAARAYEQLASPWYGASWQSSAGNGPRPAAVNPDRPWPGQERAAAIYAANLPQTGLALWGTGISLAV